MGTRINEYPNATALAGSDRFIVDGAAGTRSSLASEMLFDLIDASGVGVMHRSVYRGKNLGDTITNAQYAQIKAGMFLDLFVGDYWVVNGVNYRIVDLDYYYGSTSTPKHHAVIMPDTAMTNGPMNTTATNSTGIYNSAWFKSTRGALETRISTIFPSRTMPLTTYISSAVDSAGNIIGNTPISGMANLPHETQIYGSRLIGAQTSGASSHIDERSQFAGMLLNPSLQLDLSTTYTWLADPVKTSYFAAVWNSPGMADAASAETTQGFRPYFLVG